MNTMTYKGYTACIEFDDRDSIFIGRILGIGTVISFHENTVADLRAACVAAVDNFLTDCQQRGIHPEKPASGKLMLLVPPAVHDAALI